jgi:hypothetical protein
VKRHLTDAQRLAIGTYACRWLPRGWRLGPEDEGRIPCDYVEHRSGVSCPFKARYAEHTGISFFYWCPAHWILSGPDGTSPRDRALVAPDPRRYKVHKGSLTHSDLVTRASGSFTHSDLVARYRMSGPDRVLLATLAPDSPMVLRLGGTRMLVRRLP